MSLILVQVNNVLDNFHPVMFLVVWVRPFQTESRYAFLFTATDFVLQPLKASNTEFTEAPWLMSLFTLFSWHSMQIMFSAGQIWGYVGFCCYNRHSLTFLSCKVFQRNYANVQPLCMTKQEPWPEALISWEPACCV